MTRTHDLALDAVATYRLTRLATKDVLTQHTRDRIIRSAYKHATGWRGMNPAAIHANDIEPGAWQRWAEDDQHPPKIATLITCRWCASAYVGMLVVCARLIAPKTWDKVAKVAAFSAVAALLARLETD